MEWVRTGLNDLVRVVGQNAQQSATTEAKQMTYWARNEHLDRRM
jgi:hypothetical protein